MRVICKSIIAKRDSDSSLTPLLTLLQVRASQPGELLNRQRDKHKSELGGRMRTNQERNKFAINLYECNMLQYTQTELLSLIPEDKYTQHIICLTDSLLLIHTHLYCTVSGGVHLKSRPTNLTINHST